VVYSETRSRTRGRISQGQEWSRGGRRGDQGNYLKSIGGSQGGGDLKFNVREQAEWGGKEGGRVPGRETPQKKAARGTLFKKWEMGKLKQIILDQPPRTNGNIAGGDLVGGIRGNYTRAGERRRRRIMRIAPPVKI